MGKILAAAPAAIPICIDSNDKPYLAGILDEIDKAIRATARTITRTKLTDKVRSEVILSKAGLNNCFPYFRMNATIEEDSLNSSEPM